MTESHLTPMQHAHRAFSLAIATLERDVYVSALTELEESELVQAVVRGLFQGLGTLPDAHSHSTGWKAAQIEQRWRVGQAGNLDTPHDAVFTMNRHSALEDDRKAAEWIAGVYTLAAGALGFRELPLTESEKRPPDSVLVPLDEKHLQALRALAASQDLSEQAVMRQSLRLYQSHMERVVAGETMHWSGDAERAAQFAGTAKPPVQLIDGAVHTVMTEMARRLFVKERPGEAWVHVPQTERDKWVSRARDRLNDPSTTDSDSQLVRQAYLDGAQSMADSVKSLRLHVTLGPKATFADGMQTMQDAVNSVVDANLRAMQGLPAEERGDG